jgi:4'-phosphopantetheinyl transferase
MVNLIIAKYHTSSISALEKEIVTMLNPYELNRINNYNDENKEHRIIGFELLMQQLAYFNQKISLFDLKRTQFHQPYFKNTPFQFSISHSKDYVICLASTVTTLGVDIEFEDANLINLESDFLNEDEKLSLSINNNAKYYYYLHTRKEAISKTLGLGIYLDYNKIDVQENSVEWESNNWFLKTLHNIDNYSISYATKIENVAINISKLEF